MALASSSIICQNRALTSSALPSPGRLSGRCYSQPQLQYRFQYVRRPNSGLNLVTCTVSAGSSSSSSSSSVVKTALSDAKLQNQFETRSPTSPSGWSEFSRNVSGEWDGYGADFTSEGSAIELPESVVPEAYREWEVKVFDWQTQCPTLADPEEPSFMYKTIKLLPTVGCEADAATRYSVDERNIIGGLNNAAAAFAYQSSGCYMTVWPTEKKGVSDLFELEYCLINPQDRESRVRIIQIVRLEGTKMVLQNIRVFCEQWYGPFRNGDQLGGCAIRDTAFASTAALEASEVVGTWQGPVAVASFDDSQTNRFHELLGDSVRKSVRAECELLLLPKQLWCSLKQIEDSDDFSNEVGWLLDNRRAITSRCIFSSGGKLKEISIAHETAALVGV